MSSEKLEELNNLKRLNSIQEILNRASEIFGNAVMINDTSYNLLCYSEGIKTDDPLWNELLTTGTFSHESVDFFKNEHFIQSYAQSEAVALMRTDKLKYDRLNSRLFDKDGVQLANVLLLCCYKPQVPEDFEMLEVLSEILSEKLQDSTLYSKIDRVYQESVFNKLLDGELPKTDSDKETVTNFYDRLQRNIFIAIADTSQYDETFTHLAYFRDVFRKICPRFHYFVHKENVAMILSTDNPSLKIESDLDVLNSFFKKNRIFAGISSAFQDLNQAHKYSKQAYAALNYGQKSGRDGQFFVYDNHRASHILLKSDLHLKDIYNPAALKMQEYDLANSAQYSDLLYTYMQYGMTRSAVCEKLNVTTAELDAQLSKASELFEIDLTDGDMLMNIYITLKLIKLAKN